MKAKNASLLICFLVAALVFSSSAGVEAAASFPTKAVNLVIHSSPGGATDLAARMLAKKATEIFKQPVIVENVVGGGGFAAMAKVYSSTPDGYIIISLASSKITPDPLLRKAPYDPWKMCPVMSYGIYPFTLAVLREKPWRTVKEFIEYIRNNPGKVSLSTGAPQAMQNIAMYILKDQEKLDFKLIPFGDGAKSIAAALGGHTDGFVGVDEAIPHIKEGRMRCLATFGNERISALPDVPTLKESGYEVAVESRLAIYGPPEVPKEIIKKLEGTFKDAMEGEDFKKICQTFNITPSFLNSEQTDKYHRNLNVNLKKILLKIEMIKE